MKTALITLVILFPALVVAPAARLYKAQQPDAEALRELSSLSLPGLKITGQFEAANQGPYKVSSFRHNACDGSIALLPLYRNSEGSRVLLRLFDNPELRYGVIFNGEVHNRFPQFLFTLHQFQEKALQGTPFSVEPLQPYAFAENGQCQLAELITGII